MQLLRKTGSEAAPKFTETASRWVILADDAQPVEGVATVVSFSRYLVEQDSWNSYGGSWSVVMQPADELHEVPAAVLALAEILIEFPAYTDGRGYSHAATLRQHHGFSGELLAVGDIRRDQLDFMRETGFTAFEITGNDSVEDMRVSLGELKMPEHRLYSGASI